MDDSKGGSASKMPALDPSAAAKSGKSRARAGNGASGGRVAARPWEEFYEELKEYQAINGHCNVPQRDKEIGGLGRWVKRQRTNYRYCREGKKLGVNSMSDERIAALEAIGFRWRLGTTGVPGEEDTDPEANTWHGRLEQLKVYQQTNGNCDVPQRDGGLGRWVARQRSNYRYYQMGKPVGLSSMNPERIAALEGIGFKWRVAPMLSGKKKTKRGGGEAKTKDAESIVKGGKAKTKDVELIAGV